ncbi:hypothetical protein BH11MYX2_BH11MYX2_13090 [soil metagenome]
MAGSVAVVGLVGAVTGDAAAKNRATLGDGCVLSVDSLDVLYVIKGRLKARMGISASDITSVSVDKKTKDVTAKLVVLDCDENSGRTMTWTRAWLDARLENTAAYALHVKKNYAKAAEGFARAVADDPTWEIPADNLASAKQMGGKPDDAMTALAPWLTSHPLQTYMKIALDPELAPLLDRPELAPLRAKIPGTAAIGVNGFFADGVAINPDGTVLAVTRDEPSWGGCNFGIELELRDAKSGAVLAHAPTFAFDDTDGDCDDTNKGSPIAKRKAAVAARIAIENKALAQLGFSTPAGIERGVPGEKQDTTRFGKAKLGVATSNDGVFRVLSKDSIIAQGKGLEHLQDGYYVAQPRTIVLQTTRAGREGCEGTDPSDITVIPLPASPTTPVPAKPASPLKPR